MSWGSIIDNLAKSRWIGLALRSIAWGIRGREVGGQGQLTGVICLERARSWSECRAEEESCTLTYGNR